jgi:hypothetical protein
MNAAVAMFIYSLVPEFLMRFLAWAVVNTLYRIEKSGLEHVPEEGAAIIACNHVSFVDALVLGGNIRRPVRFVMYYKIFRIPILNFIFRTARAIPIAGAREDHSRINPGAGRAGCASRSLGQYIFAAPCATPARPIAAPFLVAHRPGRGAGSASGARHRGIARGSRSRAARRARLTRAHTEIGGWLNYNQPSFRFPPFSRQIHSPGCCCQDCVHHAPEATNWPA